MSFFSIVQSQYYDYLDAMFAVASSIFDKIEKSSLNGLIEHRGDVARSIANSVMIRLNVYENRASDPRYNRAAFIYLLTYVKPYNNEVREIENGWIDPTEWCKKQIDENSEIYQLTLQCERQAKFQC